MHTCTPSIPSMSQLILLHISGRLVYACNSQEMTAMMACCAQKTPSSYPLPFIPFKSTAGRRPTSRWVWRESGCIPLHPHLRCIPFTPMDILCILEYITNDQHLLEDVDRADHRNLPWFILHYYSFNHISTIDVQAFTEPFETCNILEKDKTGKVQQKRSLLKFVDGQHNLNVFESLYECINRALT